MMGEDRFTSSFIQKLTLETHVCNSPLPTRERLNDVVEGIQCGHFND